jgi:uncharacterized protein
MGHINAEIVPPSQYALVIHSRSVKEGAMIRSLPPLREVTLTLTARCNLRCSYCYVPAGQEQSMSDDVIDAAVELFARHADGTGELTLSFFGGEPFLQPESMERAVARARERFGPRMPRVVTPTNGLAVDGRARSLCRRNGIKLALSIDGVSSSTARPYADGRDSTSALRSRIPRILADSAERPVSARMTVTPQNVAELGRNIRAVARMGFRKIFYLPDVEQDWDEDALRRWRVAHEQIGTWLVGAHGAGVTVPDLPPWRGIEARLLLGRPKRACGAGERLVAVTTDGRLVPCYRFAFERGESHVLGTVREGFTRPDVAERFANLDPSTLHPQDGDCANCEAAEGCTHVCPAQGWLACGDPLAVPTVTCRLMRVQVDVIRQFVALARRPRRTARRPRWAAAAMVTAMAAFGVSACGGSVEAGEANAGSDDGGADATDFDVEGPGVCPVQVDASDDQVGPGQCPVQLDASDDQYAPGVCPVQVDASDDHYGPGQCPVQMDASDDQYGPGVCPVQVDGGEDAMGPGLCPYIPDASDDGMTPGIC